MTRTMQETAGSARSTEAHFIEWLRTLGTGEPRLLGTLEVTPLVTTMTGGRSWLLLHEAVAKGAIEVREIAGGGAVNEVQAFNSSGMPVLVLEGESIVGAKQNRVVVETVLVAPHTLVSIPVGCVERGRWHARTTQFDVGAMPVSPLLRRESSREAAAGRQMDQHRLWSSVAMCMAAEQVSSATDDYVQLVERKKREFEEHARALEPVAGQVGVVAAVGGALVALEVVGHADAWSVLSSRLLSSYLLWRSPEREHGERAATVRAGHRDARGWLEAVAGGTVRLKPAHGLGVGLVVTGDHFTATGLWHEDQIMHLAAFGSEK